MPINSMTGRGRGATARKGARVMVEISSVNHRQFDLRLELPPALAFIEPEARAMIHAALSRGSVSGRVHFQPGGGISAQQISIDAPLLGRLVRLAEKTERTHKVKNDLAFSSFLGVPGIVKVIPAAGDKARLKTMLKDALQQALNSIRRMRALEGRQLAEKINARLKSLDAILKAIARLSPKARRRHSIRLHELLAAAAGDLKLDKKILREAVLAAERGDISEELERSQVHLRQFVRLLPSTAPVGRTMDFLVQELMREINTIGAKVNDCAISGLVVKYKSELESIREQVQNIE